MTDILATCLRVEHVPSVEVREVKDNIHENNPLQTLRREHPSRLYHTVERGSCEKRRRYVMESSRLKLHVRLRNGMERRVFIEGYFRGKKYSRRAAVQISVAYAKRIARHMPEEVNVVEMISQEREPSYQVSDQHVMRQWLDSVLTECREHMR